MALVDRLTASTVVKALVAVFVFTLPLLSWAVELGVAWTPSHFAGLALMALAGLTWWRIRSLPPVDTTTLSGLLFVGVVIGSVVMVHASPDVQLHADSTHAKSAKQLIGLLYGAGLFTALVYLLRLHEIGTWTTRVHHWTVAAIAALTLVQFAIASYSLTSPWANVPVFNSTLGTQRALSLAYGFPRVSLTMVEPSCLATYLLSGWALWLYGTNLRKDSADRDWKWLTSGVLVGVALLATGSRLAYVVAGAMAAGVLLLRPSRGFRAAILVVTVILGVSLTGFKDGVRLVATLIPKSSPTAGSDADASRGGRASSPSPSGSPSAAREAGTTVQDVADGVERVASGLDISVQQRTASYLVALQVFRHAPLFGAGWGTAQFYMDWLWPSSLLPPEPNRKTSPTMLSHAATIVAETGLVGSLCVLGFLVGLGLSLLAAMRIGEETHHLGWGVAAAVTGYILTSFAAALITYQILLVWLLFALAASLKGGWSCGGNGAGRCGDPPVSSTSASAAEQA